MVPMVLDSFLSCVSQGDQVKTALNISQERSDIISPLRPDVIPTRVA